MKIKNIILSVRYILLTYGLQKFNEKAVALVKLQFDSCVRAYQ